jgi:hypothetical protein
VESKEIEEKSSESLGLVHSLKESESSLGVQHCQILNGE